MTIRYALTQQELADYNRDGFLIRHNVFSPQEVVELQRSAEEAVEVAFNRSLNGNTYILDGKRFVDSEYLTVQFEHDEGSETIRVIEPVHELATGLDALLDDPRISDPMRDLVGSEDLALWTAKLNLKRPKEGSGFGWHQDSPYWIHDCNHIDQLPNVLLTFDDANESNGCLRVIQGSHKNGCLAGTTDGSQLGGFFTDPSAFEEEKQVAMEAEAGSLVFFSQHAIHGSQPNLSDNPRRAIIMTYQPAGFAALKSKQVRAIA